LALPRKRWLLFVTASNGICTAELTPRLRPARFDDYQQIAALGSKYGLGKETYDEWTNLWLGNPVLPTVPDCPIGWVFESEDRRVVGHVANVPLAYQLGKQRLIACASRSLMVDPPYRSYSFQLLSEFFRQKSIDLYLATTVNAQAAKLYEVFRAVRVPAGTWNNSAFWITNYPGFSASALKMKDLPGAKALGYPTGAALWARDVMQGRFFKTRTKSIEPEFGTGFDDRFQVFWQELCERYPQRLLADRSRKALEWHFKPALAKNWIWTLTVSHGSQLTAYAIFQRQDNPDLGLIRMRLVDFQTLHDQNELLLPILSSALERCRQEHIHMLEASGFAAEKQKFIDSLSPCGRPLDAWRFLYKAAQPGLAERLKDPTAWDPSCLDGDASL
jgi:hypothetical protein